ncbi:50S ribosomal protein L3 [Candidatus Foliamicus sp.]
MSIGLIGQKRGMTRLFTEDGVSVPITVIEASPNRVTRRRTPQQDGYAAIQVTVGEARKAPGKAAAGQYGGQSPGKGLYEHRLADPGQLESYEPGSELTVALFSPGQRVDVTGTTIGKGYAGTIKRHHFRGQDATHGNSKAHRVPGSIGQNQTPGRVFKGKKMSGHLGAVRRTVQNLEVMRIDEERNLILVKGAIPGHAMGRVLVRPAVKTPMQTQTSPKA